MNRALLQRLQLGGYQELLDSVCELEERVANLELLISEGVWRRFTVQLRGICSGLVGCEREPDSGEVCDGQEIADS